MSNVSIKGTREGLTITLGEGEWQPLLDDLTAQLERPGAHSFFRGGRILLETGDHALDAAKLKELAELLAHHEMSLNSVCGHPESQAAFEQIRASLPPPADLFAFTDEAMAVDDSLSTAEEPHTLLYRDSVRSGHVLQHNGTVVIFGNVDSGGRVIADGDVFVWGTLRGSVHAGAAGDSSAIVGALVLAPSQLRISGRFARGMDRRQEASTPAQVARVQGDQIIIEPWSV